MRKNLTKRRFGYLRVLRVSHTHPKRGNFWLCRCDCGRELPVLAASLLSKNTKSCGCKKSQICAQRATTHGLRSNPAYPVWHNMWTRCTDPTARKYENYGGRGISVCRRWKSLRAFVTDMGPRPPGTTLDRKDPNGNYTPSNCRWATRREQNLNKRTTKRYEWKGRLLTVMELTKLSRRSACTVRSRLGRLGWTVEEAMADS